MCASVNETLRPRGVLFCSSPRGNNEEGFGDGRYSCFFDLDTWRNYVRAARFYEVGHYYRPPGLACHQQPWLATVWRKGQTETVLLPKAMKTHRKCPIHSQD